MAECPLVMDYQGAGSRDPVGRVKLQRGQVSNEPFPIGFRLRRSSEGPRQFDKERAQGRGVSLVATPHRRQSWDLGCDVCLAWGLIGDAAHDLHGSGGELSCDCRNGRARGAER
jgi:hypothetical protein